MAVKTILFQDGGRAADGRTVQGPNMARAYAEAAITFSLVHPNVVSTYHHEVKLLQPEEADYEGRSGAPVDMKLFLVQVRVFLSLG